MQSNVDELYRIALGYQTPAWRELDASRGWTSDTYAGVPRLSAYATADGTRGGFVRVPDWSVTIAILTNDDSADVRRMTDEILARLRR